MTILALVLDFGLGAVIGAFGGLFGVGGGVIAVPVLALLYGLDQQHAQGTAMVMVAPNVLLGLRRYRQKGSMDNRMALTLAASAMVFTLPFALLGTHVSSRALRTAFSYATAGDVEWPTGIALAVGGLSTVSAGVALAHRLPERTMRLLFCALMLVTAPVLALRR
jgi:uncharacterized membrane protein YfcA